MAPVLTENITKNLVYTVSQRYFKDMQRIKKRFGHPRIVKIECKSVIPIATGADQIRSEARFGQGVNEGSAGVVIIIGDLTFGHDYLKSLSEQLERPLWLT